MAVYKDSSHYKAKGKQMLEGLRNAVDSFSVASGEGSLLVTEEWRPVRPGKPSFHPKGQAEDWRTNNKPQWWKDGVIAIILGFKEADARIQFDDHPELVGTQNEHMHVEYDTGDPE